MNIEVAQFNINEILYPPKVVLLKTHTQKKTFQVDFVVFALSFSKANFIVGLNLRITCSECWKRCFQANRKHFFFVATHHNWIAAF